MKIQSTSKDLAKSPISDIAVFVSQTKTKGESKVVFRHSDKAVQNLVTKFADSGRIKGGAKSCSSITDTANDRTVFVLGLGDKKDVNDETLRCAGAALHKSMKGVSIDSVAVDMNTAIKAKDASKLSAFVEGMTLASYKYDELKTQTKDEEAEMAVDLHIARAAKAQQNTIAAGVALAEAVNFARRLGDAPGNHMTPTILAENAKAGAKGTAMKVTVWDKAKIAKEGMGGLIGVSNGSAEEPRFIIMTYNGAAKSKAPITFVGKGLTFDCGGISIKPSAGMEEMKYDMCGGAAVIGAMIAIAKLKLKVNAVAYIPASENLAGPAATKPGDVHTFRNGKTAEINNTDAEGRLILADALSYASEKKPAAIVDAATLTGAMVISLGSSYTCYFTSNDKFDTKIQKAGKASCEKIWRMPVDETHSSDMKGTYADLSNIGKGREAGSSTAAAFLKEFVPEEIPYAHFDIAGTAWHRGKRNNYDPARGASGVMVRTFVEIAKQF